MYGVLVGMVHILCEIRHVVVKMVGNTVVDVDRLVYLCDNLGGGLGVLFEIFERIVMEDRHFRLLFCSYSYDGHLIFQILSTGCCSNALARR